MSHKRLVKLVLVGFIVGLLLASGWACSESTSTGENDITVASSTDSGHSHKVTISGSDLDNPPTADKTIDTTYSGGHRHTVTLTQQDYESIKGGSEVTATSSSSGGHTHTFVIKK